MSDSPSSGLPWWLRPRLWRWVVRILALLVVLAAGAVVYLLLYPPSLDPFEQRIESLLSRRLDRPVAYGKLDWQWRGDLHVRVHDLEVDDGAVRVERLLLGVDIWALLRGETRFTGLVLEGVAAELPYPAPRTAAGSGAEDAEALDERVARLGGLAARFDRLVVRDAHVHLTGRHAPPGGAAELSEWDFELADSGGGYWLETEARWGGGRVGVSGRIDNLRQGFEDWQLALQARASGLDLARIAPLLPPAGPEAMTGEVIARVTLEGQPLVGDWSAEGEVDLSGAGIRWPAHLTGPRSDWDLETGFRFQQRGERRELDVRRVSLARGPAQVTGSTRVAWGGDRPRGPRLETDLQFQAASLAAYQPLYGFRVVPEGLRAWLDQALVAGRVGPAEVVIDGPVADLPFPRGRGTFRVEAPVSGLELRYLPDWLPVTAGAGVLTVDRERLRFRGRAGRILTSPIRRVTVAVADLTTRNPVLRLDGEVDLDLADGAEFLARSPLVQPGFLGPLQPVGPGRLHLGLRAVLGPPGPQVPEDRVRAWGQVDLHDAAVDLGPERSPLVKLRGTVAFEGRRLYADPLTAHFRGRPVTGSLRTEPNGPWRFQAETRLPGRDLQHGLLPGLPTRLLGNLNLRLEGAIPPEGPGHYQLNVGLGETALVLPEPLFKPMGQPGRFVVSGRLGPRRQTEVHLAYPGARWAFSLTEDDEGLHLGGAVGVNRPAPDLEQDRLIAAGDMGRLRVERWMALLRELGGALPSRGDARPWRPVSLDIGVNTESLSWYDTNLGQVSLGVRGGPNQQGFQGAAQLSGDRIQGSIRWERPAGGRPKARVAMERIDLSGLGAQGGGEPPVPAAEAEAEAKRTKREVAPAPQLNLDLSVSVERLIRDRLTLQDYRLNARLYPERWHLDDLEATVADDSRFYLDGTWQRGAGTLLNGSLRTGDFGRLLKRAGLYPSMRGGRGRISGGLAWQGPPWAFDPGELQGGFAAQIADGDLLELTFLSKALATLNILDLPQQVLGGFKELRSSGLHYRFMQGTAVIADGVLRTDDWRLESAPLLLEIDGGLDLGRRRYDLHIRAQPLQTIDQVVAAIPLFGYLITGKDKAFTDLRYHVTGPWSDPQVQAPIREKEQGFWSTFYERIRRMQWRDLVPWRAPRDEQ